MSGNVTPGIPVKLAAPAQRALTHAGIATLKQLASKTRDEIAAMHGIGPNALKQLEKALREKGMSFAGER